MPHRNKVFVEDADGDDGILGFESPQAFCDHYGLLRPLVPFPFHESTPVAWLLAIRDELDDLPPTAKSMSVGAVHADFNRMGAHWPFFEGLVRIAGTWDAPGRNQLANPDYVHDGPVLDFADYGEMETYLRQMADVGIFGHRQLSPRLGVREKELHKIIKYRDIPWQSLREDGKRRMGRTLATIREWTDYTYADLGRAIDDRPTSTIRTWVKHYGEEDPEFTVPNLPVDTKSDLVDSQRVLLGVEEWYGDVRERLLDGEPLRPIADANDRIPCAKVMTEHLTQECNCEHPEAPLQYDHNRRRWVVTREGERPQGVPADD